MLLLSTYLSDQNCAGLDPLYNHSQLKEKDPRLILQAAGQAPTLKEPCRLVSRAEPTKLPFNLKLGANCPAYYISMQGMWSGEWGLHSVSNEQPTTQSSTGLWEGGRTTIQPWLHQLIRMSYAMDLV